MKNITKLGLTALAGSLVASSAFAGAMSVSGSAKITHASADETEVQGNSFSNSKGLSFSGSGELDNGWTVSTTYSMTNSAFSSSQVTIDMGDQGTVGLWNNANGAGINKYSGDLDRYLELLKDSNDIIIVLIFTLIFGVLTSVISSYFVTQKYLNLKTSEHL